MGYGSSFGGNPWRQHIGLGKHATIDQIEVKWLTSGKTERFDHVRPNQSYHLREGDGKLAAVEHKSFAINADHMKMPAISK